MLEFEINTLDWIILSELRLLVSAPGGRRHIFMSAGLAGSVGNRLL